MHDLKSRLNAATHIYNPSKPPFDKGGFFLCLHTNAEPRIRLKEPAIAGYVYNPPQTPPFEKEGLVVSLWLTSPKVSNILSVTSSFCTISTVLYAKIKRSKIGAICKKKKVLCKS